MTESLHEHIAAATEAAQSASRRDDYRRKFIYLGVGVIHAVNGLSLSLDRLARVLEQPTKEKP